MKTKKPPMLSSPWLSTHPNTIEITVQSKATGREEEFKLLALATVTGFPLLFIGDAGTGKSMVIRDFASAISASPSKVFTLLVDDFMHPSEILGKPDMEKFFNPEKPEYHIDCPITDAEFIFLDEIHNSNSGFKNSILSVMADREVHLGKNRLKLSNYAFVSAVNEYPKVSQQKAFWDRFVFKHNVSRLNETQYFQHLSLLEPYNYPVIIPGEDVILPFLDIPIHKLSVLYNACKKAGASDRTLLKLPVIIKVIKEIWKITIDDAIIKAAYLISGMTTGAEVKKEIYPKHIQELKSQMDVLNAYSQHNFQETFDLVYAKIQSAKDSKHITDEEFVVLNNEMQSIKNRKMLPINNVS